MVCLVLYVMDAASEEGGRQATFHFFLYTETLLKPHRVGTWLTAVHEPQSECLWGWEAGIWEMKCSSRVGLNCSGTMCYWS